MSATILIADDEPGIVEMLAWELGRHGYDVVGVRNGTLAIEKSQ